MTERLLYYCPLSVGGVADYAHFQASALAEQSIDVTLLCGCDWPYPEPTAYRQLRQLSSFSHAHDIRWLSRLSFARYQFTTHLSLVRVIRKTGIRRVLMAAYVEYLAPLWAPWLNQLRGSGVVFGAIVHDPVRDYVVGPLWWHRWSVAEGYSFLREAFVHAEIDLSVDQSGSDTRTTIIPHGPYEFPEPTQSRQEIRRDLSLPGDAAVLLSFGHIRDGKSLDLVLQAMAEVKNVYLVVAGSEGSPAQRPVAYYQELAERLGIADRCRWLIKFIEPGIAANLFAAADFGLLTYNSSFRSASGVLNVAVRYRKPVLASCGEGALGVAVERYRLGIRVQPDSAKAVAKGLNSLLRARLAPDWEQYRRDHSWVTNARAVIKAMDLVNQPEIR
jgi:glycosyltransferase involved in cell wall biosynthesis